MASVKYTVDGAAPIKARAIYVAGNGEMRTVAFLVDTKDQSAADFLRSGVVRCAEREGADVAEIADMGAKLDAFFGEVCHG